MFAAAGSKDRHVKSCYAPKGVLMLHPGAVKSKLIASALD